MGWEIVFAPRSESDLAKIVSHIANDDPAAAIRFGETLIHKAESLADVPGMGPLLPGKTTTFSPFRGMDGIACECWNRGREDDRVDSGASGRVRVRAYLRAGWFGREITSMKTRYYSPRLDRDLITVLYRLRRARRVPMTALASQLIRAALRYEGVLDNNSSATGDQPAGQRQTISLKAR